MPADEMPARRFFYRENLRASPYRPYDFEARSQALPVPPSTLRHLCLLSITLTPEPCLLHQRINRRDFRDAPRATGVVHDQCILARVERLLSGRNIPSGEARRQQDIGRVAV